MLGETASRHMRIGSRIAPGPSLTSGHQPGGA